MISPSWQPELYKLFLEKIIKIIEFSNGKAGLIIPSTFTNDLSCSKIRKFIIKKIIKDYFTTRKCKNIHRGTQAFAILILDYKKKEDKKKLKLGKIKKEQVCPKLSLMKLILQILKNCFLMI